MSNAPIARRPHQPRAPLGFLPGLGLARARAHEFCGPARRFLALLAARAADPAGPVFWIRPAWAAERPNPDGFAALLDPARLVFLSPRRPEDMLWTMEEVLRSGAVPLVIADLPGVPGLTPVRRLHLAAETGMAEGRTAPVGLLLCPDAGGAAGIESRWHIAPRHRAGAMRWHLTRRRARTEPPAAFTLTARGRDLAVEAGGGEVAAA